MKLEKLDLKRKHCPRNRKEIGKWSASYNVKLYQGHCIKVSGNRRLIYRLYHYILSWVLELISDWKCYINIGTIFSGYWAKGTGKYCVGWNLRMSIRLLGRCASDNVDTSKRPHTSADTRLSTRIYILTANALVTGCRPFTSMCEGFIQGIVQGM
jgi:hypothetical protein